MRQILRKLYKRIPEQRRTTLALRDSWQLALRKLVAPLLSISVVVRGNRGLRYWISTDPTDEKVVQDLLHHKRSLYFPPLAQTLPPTPLILDIGAHHGHYIVSALDVYPNSRAICVEPSQQAVTLIKRNLTLNKLEERVTIIKSALANEAGEGELKICVRGTWGNSLYEADENTIATEKVQLATLLEILQGEQPDILKCNAEGGEYALVSQLVESQLRPLLLVIMVHDDFGDTNQLVETMQQLGYNVQMKGSKLRPCLHCHLQALST